MKLETVRNKRSVQRPQKQTYNLYRKKENNLSKHSTILYTGLATGHRTIYGERNISNF